MPGLERHSPHLGENRGVRRLKDGPPPPRRLRGRRGAVPLGSDPPAASGRDPAAERASLSSLQSSRAEYAGGVARDSKGLVVGRVRFVAGDDAIDCTRMGGSGQNFPSYMDRVSGIATAAPRP